MHTLVALFSGTYGVILFGVALRRAIRLNARPLTYAVDFINAISLVAVALGLSGLMPLQRAVLMSVTLNLASTMMMAADTDKLRNRRVGGIVSGSL